jgi:L-glyceraldehyde 3-phosphate reductase
LKPDHLTEEKMRRVRALASLAEKRGQSLAQLAVVWLLNRPAVTSVLIGASSLDQIRENISALDNDSFSLEELQASDAACIL